MKSFLRFLCVLLAVVFTAGIFASSAVSLALWSVRNTLSPEFVSDTAVNLDFASVRFPDGFGGFTTVPEQLNTVLREQKVGYTITDESFNGLCRDLSLDLILRDFLLDLRVWLLDDGPVPSLNPEATAARAVSGMNGGILSIFSNPVSFTASLIRSFVNADTLSRRITALSPLRDLLSGETIAFTLSLACSFAILLFFALRTRFLPTLTFSALAVSLAGAAAYFGQRLAAPYKNSVLLSLSMPESTFDIVYRPLMNGLSRTGFIALVAGAAVCLVSAFCWIVVSAVRRASARKARGGDPLETFEEEQVFVPPYGPEDPEAAKTGADFSEAGGRTRGGAEETDG